MKALILILSALLAASCTTPHTSPPLAPTPTVVIPPSNPNPPPPQPLLVTLSIGVTDPTVGTNISFVALTNGSAITRAEWSFGNGATASTQTADTAYAYPAEGTYDARVIVTANDGRTGSDHRTVTVTRRPPPPEPPAPPPAPGPNTTGFAASIRCVPKPAGQSTPCQAMVTYNGEVQPSSTIFEVRWDFGDGGLVLTTTPVVSHPYAGAGTYTVFADVYATSPNPPSPDNRVVSTTITVP